MPPLVLSPEQIGEANVRLEGKSAETILRWAVAAFFPRLSMGTAFGAEGCCLIHMLAQIEPRVYIFNLDTGYQFPQTLALRDRIRERYGIAVEFVRPELSVEEYERRHGGALHTKDPDQCCFDRKISVLRRVAESWAAWITAIRGDQTTHRSQAAIVQADLKFNVIKINPLLRWTKQDVWSFVKKHDVPYNPLHDEGYPSIGCWPCTRPVTEDEDDRAGRWAGTNKTECGLHISEIRPAA